MQANMKKVIFTFAFLSLVSISFAQTNGKGVHSKKLVVDSSGSVTIAPDTINGSYYSIEQGKVIPYKALITKEEIANITNCPGYIFRDSEGKVIAYTPCKDYSFRSLVVLDKDKFIEWLRANAVSLK